MSDLVAAVVVTFNRVDKLPKVLESILAQTRQPDMIVVVDNASTDSTPSVLKGFQQDPRFVIKRLPRNTGGAGGFAAGMEEAYARGSDWVWIMDDDCYPDAEALERLHSGQLAAEQELGHPVPFSCSLVRYIDGSICEMNNPVTTWDWGRLIVRGQQNVLIRNCSFVSVLIPRRTIAKHGLPLEEYFIWFDDMEYTLRVSANGPGVQVLDSVVVHDLPTNRGVNFGDLNENNSWKFFYGARNESSYLWHHENKLEWLKFVLTTYVWMRRAGVARRLQLGVARRILRGITFDPKPRTVRTVL